jgi:hypothetical protein
MLLSATYLCIDLGGWTAVTTICTYDSTGARTHMQVGLPGMMLGAVTELVATCARQTRADKIGILACVSSSLEEDFKQGLLEMCDNPLPDVRVIKIPPAQMRGKTDIECCDMVVRELMSHS